MGMLGLCFRNLQCWGGSSPGEWDPRVPVVWAVAASSWTGRPQEAETQQEFKLDIPAEGALRH